MRILPGIGSALLLLLLLGQEGSGQQRLCCFGDSITEGWIDAEYHPRQAWPAILDSMLRVHGEAVSVLSVAHGGETSSDALRRAQSEVLARQPDCSILAFGSNDMYIWGEPSAPRVPLSTFRDQLRLLVRMLQGGGGRVILLDLPPMREERFYDYADSAYYAAYGGARHLQRRYSTVIREVALAEQAEFVSLEAAFENAPALLGFDGVHPSREGHQAIASALSDPVRKQLSAESRDFPDASFSVFPVPYIRGSAPIAMRVHAPTGTRIQAEVLDMSGRMRRKIVYFTHTNGVHFLPWDGRTQDGTLLPSGAYTLRVLIGTHTVQKQILFL